MFNASLLLESLIYVDISTQTLRHLRHSNSCLRHPTRYLRHSKSCIVLSEFPSWHSCQLIDCKPQPIKRFSKTWHMLLGHQLIHDEACQYSKTILFWLFRDFSHIRHFQTSLEFYFTKVVKHKSIAENNFTYITLLSVNHPVLTEIEENHRGRNFCHFNEACRGPLDAIFGFDRLLTSFFAIFAKKIHYFVSCVPLCIHLL